MDLEALYIRNPSDTEARGPFTARQVADLADAGQVTPQTLVFEAGTQQWMTVGSLPDLMTIVLPEKKKLTLKAKEFKPLNQPDVLEKKLDVQDMLNAAEGKTEETASRRDPTEAMSRAAAVGRYGAILGLLLAAVAALFPLRDALLALDSTKVLAQPLACVGFFDLALAVLLALGVTATYPLTRFRAAAGLGLVGFTYYAQGFGMELTLTTFGCAGIFFCTIVVRMVPALLAAALSIGGMGLLAWSVVGGH
jgi:hypothetical protein